MFAGQSLTPQKLSEVPGLGLFGGRGLFKALALGRGLFRGESLFNGASAVEIVMITSWLLLLIG